MLYTVAVSTTILKYTITPSLHGTGPHTTEQENKRNIEKPDLVFLVLDVEEQGSELGTVLVSSVTVDFEQLLFYS